ncbi:phosphoribosyl-dephospho-CoA transferase MdcG domain-containing protein [Massilibacteroides sp.]|uniref:phosphoribosyl-dephospho-CoA transferase MdcG domain-containing protein n=1 Tax=Massilibacteroides sp. TaxID=2034766 RepID=UPI00263275B3|nr:phosphoribosyl-dephospho-CoA transferase MdcG domain-containing protein [Massilibacteroides sp.]MDD4516617.1 malonate decarboxylase holo-[acyl-carrier-protein] synthase [Massilibacteroides sp.]
MQKKSPSVHDMIWLKSKDCTSLALLPEWMTENWHLHLPLVVCRDKCLENMLYACIRGKHKDERYKVLVNHENIKKIQTAEEVLQLVNKSDNIDLFSHFQQYSIISDLAQTVPEIGIIGSWGFSLAISEKWVDEKSDINLIFKLAVNTIRREKWMSIYKVLKLMETQITITIENCQGGFSLEEWLTKDYVFLDTVDGLKLTPNYLIV